MQEGFYEDQQEDQSKANVHRICLLESQIKKQQENKEDVRNLTIIIKMQEIGETKKQKKEGWTKQGLENSIRDIIREQIHGVQ